jgi:hypothetical protein
MTGRAQVEGILGHDEGGMLVANDLEDARILVLLNVHVPEAVRVIDDVVRLHHCESY